MTQNGKKSSGDFRYEILSELPGMPKKVVFIPENKLGVGQDGLIVKICPSNETPWIGIFAFGDLSSSAECSVLEGPGPNFLSIVAQGEGYIVSPCNPRLVTRVKVYPVFGAVEVPLRGLVLFYDYTNIAAYNESGLLWLTKRISWDGIEITSVSENEIVGKSWDSPNDRNVEFNVNLADGSHRGGASPPE